MVTTENTTLTFTQVRQNMNTWNNIRNNPGAVISFFTNKNLFDFSPIINIFEPSISLHFYPAISGNDFFLYIIDKDKDNLETYMQDPEGFTGYIREARLKEGNILGVNAESEIPEREARDRVEDWDSNYPTYFIEDAPSKNVFLAFEHPPLNIKSNGFLEGSFGLYRDGGAGPWKADIILKDSGESYYNTVRPVPPFGQGGGNQFFLLSATIS